MLVLPRGQHVGLLSLVSSRRAALPLLFSFGCVLHEQGGRQKKPPVYLGKSAVPQLSLCEVQRTTPVRYLLPKIMASFAMGGGQTIEWQWNDDGRR